MALARPVEGALLNCMLPNELIRSVVSEVMSDNLCIVRLSVSTPIAKTHHYKRDDFVPVRRTRDDFGQTVWVAISEHEMEAAAREEAEQAAARESAAAEIAANQPPEPAPRPTRHEFAVAKAGD